MRSRPLGRPQDLGEQLHRLWTFAHPRDQEIVREYPFHTTRRWRFDLAWPDRQVAVECEGGIWTAGRHVRGRGFLGDIEKYNEAVLAGWTLVRVTGDMIQSGAALGLIERALNRSA